MKKILSLLLLATLTASAQLNVNTNLNSFPAFSELSITNLTPTKEAFAARIDLRAGYGLNLTSHDPIAAAALSVSISPSLALGIVASHDRTGWCVGGITLGVNGSVAVPLIGRLDCFAGDGVAYDVKYHGACNYLFIGAERPWLLWGFRLAPGISLANTSTRAGTDLFGGLSVMKTF